MATAGRSSCSRPASWRSSSVRCFDARPFPDAGHRSWCICAFSLAHLSHHARRGADQTSRRSGWRDLTALYLSLRNPADPQSAQPLVSLPAARGLESRRGVQSCRGTGCAWFAFGPRIGPPRRRAVIVLFRSCSSVGGNLSFLNWLTIVPALACFDDSFWAKLLPRALVNRAELSRRGRATKSGRCNASWGWPWSIVLVERSTGRQS